MATRQAKLQVSNPGRVIDAGSGITKLDLVRYCALLGERR
jgi:DNA primase